MPPNDRTRPPSQQGWRGATPGKPGHGQHFGWKPDDHGVDVKRLKRRIKLSAWLVGGLSCVALIVFLVWLLRPQKSATLILVGIDPAGDVENLDTALDLYGWQAGRHLAEWSEAAAKDERFSRSKMAPQLLDGKSTPESVRLNTLDEWLKNLDRRDLHTLIIYFGLHGGADANGPFLFTAGGGKLHLRELIEGIARHPGLKKKKIVVLLDPARILPDPALGMLTNDCVRSLKSLDRNDHLFDSVPNLVVMCSSDAGEQGYSAEEWGTTGFAQMVQNGLAGDADPSNGNLINAWDLFRYVRERTASWSADRLTPQTPILLPETGGEERAKAMELSVRPRDWSPAKWPELRSQVNAPQSLTDHWSKCFELEKSTPSPAVYSPLLWRRYRELLLRYEQLLRAEEKDVASSLDGKLRDIETKLTNDRSLRASNGMPLGSRGNSLSMATALGVPSTWTMSDPALERAWKSPDSPAVLNELLNSEAGKADPAAVRLQIYRRVFAKAINANSGPEGIGVAAKIFEQTPLRDSGKRPAEAHSLLLDYEFFRRLGIEPPMDLLRQSLVLRQLAERAALSETGIANRHPYSEAIWPHSKKGIIDADITRRDGEDLLLASNDSGFTRVKGEQSSAQKKYEAQLADAKKLQDAYAIRDEALADLPLLTRWIALQLLIPSTNKSDEQTKQMLADAELLPGLWAKVHELARQLDGTERLAGVGSLADIRSAIDQLKKHYVHQCADLSARDLQGIWRQSELLLAAPPMFIDVDTRKNLMNNNRRQAVKLTGAWQGKPRSEASPSASPADAEASRDARARTLQQGQLAAAVLGEFATEQPRDVAGTPLYSADNLREKLSDLAKNDQWQPIANRLGDDIGRHWRLLSPNDSEGTDDKLTELRSRWSIAFRPIKFDTEPAGVNRRKRWRELLVGMALRSARDHCYELNPELPAYYRDVAKLFLTDAANIGGGTGVLDEEKEVKSLLEARALDLKRDGFDDRINWTSENYRQLGIRVNAPKVGPGGYVVLWGDLKPNASLELAKDAQTRMPAALPDANRQIRVNAILHSARDAAAADLAFNGYFRGQWLNSKSTIRLNRAPDRILTWVQPVQDAAVAVRASDDLDLGAIAIVLDFSGSMRETPTNRFNENTEDSTCKYQQALKTIREVLLDLPQNTPLCIRVFGHGEPMYRDTDPIDVKTKATRDEVFFRGKVNWRRGANEAPLDTEIMQKLRDNKPKNFTPLLRTMINAKADFPKNYEGSKTMLVLSDGADTMYGTGPQAVAQVKAQFNNEFSKADVGVQLILFSWDKDERKTVSEQFQDVTGFSIPGRLRFADNNTELREFIDQALRPKLRLLKAGSPAPRTNPEGKTLPGAGLAANRQSDELRSLRWSDAFKPDFYKGLVYNAKQEFEFQPGDRMLVRIFKDKSGRIAFERDLFARLLMGRGPTPDETSAGWMMGVGGYRANRDNAGNHLKFTGMLECLNGRSPGDTGVLQQVYPGFVWWDVTTIDGKRPKVIHIAARTRNPVAAPAWNLTAEAYSERADDYKPAAIRAWVDERRPSASYPPAPIDPGKLDTGIPIRVQGEDGEAQVFLAIEDKVDVTNGELTNMPYLVIRVLHPAGKPVFVRPPPASGFTASEQRYYSESNAVTAVFGPVSKETIEKKLNGAPLELISVSQFQEGHKPIEWKMPPANPSEQDFIYPQALGNGSGDGSGAPSR